MRPMNAELQKTILSVSKAAFFSDGFQGANIRSIAKLSGVTTGAIYRHFPNKEAIFDALVEEPAQYIIARFRTLTDEMNQTLLEDTSGHLKWVSADTGELIDYVYSNFDAFRLLASCAAGTKHERFIDQLIEIETQATMQYIAHMKRAGIVRQELDEQLVHITASAYYNGFFEPIVHEMPKEKALEYTRTLAEFYAAGWRKILGL